jgi:hypothetical protein
MVTPMALIYKGLFASIATFETPPKHHNRIVRQQGVVKCLCRLSSHGQCPPALLFQCE